IILMPCLNPILGAIDGALADKGDFEKGATMAEVHYYSWAIMCYIYFALIVVFGTQLVKLLRYNMAMTKKDGLSEATIRHSIKVMIFTMIALGSLGLIFALMLTMYAVFRVQIHSHLPSNVLIACLWLFCSPMLILATYVGITYSIYFNNEIASKHTHSSKSSSKDDRSSNYSTAVNNVQSTAETKSLISSQV
ncbi:hypothetical protein HDU76_013413, partial [Blyttiomyces sp. JEL0837]